MIHFSARAIEYMIVDALMAAEDYLKIAERIHDPRKYVHLTDSIMDRIQESTEPVRCTLVLFSREALLMGIIGTCGVTRDLQARSHPRLVQTGRL
jgi:hypothetical protein